MALSEQAVEVFTLLRHKAGLNVDLAALAMGHPNLSPDSKMEAVKTLAAAGQLAIDHDSLSAQIQLYSLVAFCIDATTRTQPGVNN